MSESPPLHGLALYNPHLLSEDELVGFFVARKELLAKLISELPGDDDDGVPQPQLIVGQRGMGKTMLLRRMAAEIGRDEAVSARWIALTFPEEQYDVAQLSDFWLNCIDALSDALERLGDAESAAALDRAFEALPQAEEAIRCEKALRLLTETSRALDRRLVLLVDNIDLIFDRIDEQQWLLRESLAARPEIALIGASTRAIESTFKYDRAFYEFFRIRELGGLDLDEMQAMLTRFANRLRNEQVAAILEKDPARIEALHTLTGGNPRTVALLFQVLGQGLEGDVRADFERLLDQHTPLYKARFEAMPEQLQRVVHAVALSWYPATARDLANTLRLDINIVSSQLNRLVKQGVIEKVWRETESRFAFQIAERFFNIWYLMRASPQSRRKLVWLAELLWLMHAPGDLAALADDTEKYDLADFAQADEIRQRVTPYIYDELPEDLREPKTWTDRCRGMTDIMLAVREEGGLFMGGWVEIVRFFRDAVSAGHITDATKLLDETGMADRWLPLREALEAIVRGSRGYLRGVAPEVRKPAEELLAQLVGEDWIGEQEAVAAGRGSRKRRARRRE